jgi:hypothetical protein
MVTKQTVTIEPHQDRILSIATLGERWDIHPKVALSKSQAATPANYSIQRPQFWRKAFRYFEG